MTETIAALKQYFWVVLVIINYVIRYCFEFRASYFVFPVYRVS